MTTFSLIADSSGFEAAAEKVQNVFTNDILTARQKQRLGCQMLVNLEFGECIIVSFWHSEEDAENSRRDRSYYSGGQQKLWPFVRYKMPVQILQCSFPTRMRRISQLRS